MSLVNIKNAIKARLDVLVGTGDLAGATISDIRKDPLSVAVGAYPHAFVMPPAIASASLDNRTNVRTYSFHIMVLYNAENITGTSDLEASIETLLSSFDNNPTLGGTALAGLEPTASSPHPFQHGGKDLIMVIVELEAKDTVTLTYT